MKADIFYDERTQETVLTIRAESCAEGAALKLLGPRLGLEVEHEIVGAPTTARRKGEADIFEAAARARAVR